MTFKHANLKQMMLVALLVLQISAVLWQNSMAQTRLGLHVTQEELNIWKQRAAEGPYRTKEDVSTNSPGDWDHIKSNADAFLANPSAELWLGQETPECARHGDPGPSLKLGKKLRDAAFVYLITGNAAYRNAVRDVLLAQAAEPGTKFADRTRWCPDVITGTVGPVLDITMWLTKILFGYDYIRSSLSQSTRDTLDNWFLNAALFFNQQPSHIAEKRWPNRDSDDYTSSPWPLGSSGPLYLPDGPTWYQWHDAWGNQTSSPVRFVGLVGIMLRNAFLKNKAKRWFKEWLKYHVWSDGTEGELHKSWKRDNPCLGWAYSGSTIGAMVTLADHYARAGDFELYEFSTSDGYHGTSDGPKSLLQVILLYQDYVDHTILRYGTDDENDVGDPDYLLDSECGLPVCDEWHGIQDIWFTPMANIYYQNDHIKDVYMRTAPNTPSYPASPASGGFNAWGGEQGIYPGVLFMFGDMEGKVWPYPAGDLSPPNPPANLTIK